MLSANKNPSPSENLVWSDGFGWKFLPCVIACLLVSHCTSALEGVSDCAHDWLPNTPPLAGWALLGLLSSNCCVLQLVLNAFNFGCAGFNYYLGQIRPIFLALTIMLQVSMWEHNSQSHDERCVMNTLVALVLCFVPEAVDAWNRRRMVISTMDDPQTVSTLSLGGVKCVACVSAVRVAVERFMPSPVVAFEISLEQSEMTLLLDSDSTDARSAAVARIIDEISSIGFEACLKETSIEYGSI